MPELALRRQLTLTVYTSLRTPITDLGLSIHVSMLYYLRLLNFTSLSRGWRLVSWPMGMFQWVSMGDKANGIPRDCQSQFKHLHPWDTHCHDSVNITLSSPSLNSREGYQCGSLTNPNKKLREKHASLNFALRMSNRGLANLGLSCHGGLVGIDQTLFEAVRCWRHVLWHWTIPPGFQIPMFSSNIVTSSIRNCSSTCNIMQHNAT